MVKQFLTVVFAAGVVFISNAEDQAKDFKTIGWQERKDWIETVKPIDYWVKRNKTISMGMAGGVMSIIVDGKPMPPLTSYTGHVHDNCYYEKVDRKYHDAMCEAMAEGKINYQFLNAGVYLKNKVVAWGRARSQAAEFMKKNPDVRFFIRMNFIVDRKWFSKEYPGNMTLFEDGTESHWTKNGEAKERYSFASNIWERLAAEGLVEMIKQLPNEPYGDRVLGIMVTFGVSGEGNWWSEFDWRQYGIDYSPAMQDYFRNYLRNKYCNDVKKLQFSWGKEVTFENAQIPSVATRGTDVPSSCNEEVFRVPGAFGFFRNPQENGTAQSIDFHMAMCNVLAERLSYFCHVVKKASDGKLLAGGLHSPPFAAALFQWNGSGAFGEIMKSPYIDFDATPWTYEGRNLGEGLYFRGPVDSMALHGKCLWMECDTRTSTINPAIRNGERQYGAPLNVDGDRENLRRDFMRLITSQANGYWYEITFPWFTLPEQREVIKEIGKLSTKLVNLDRKRNSEIAVIYDLNSIFYTTEFVDFISLCRQMLQEFIYIGADFDMYTIDDIGTPEADNHKLFIFPNAISLNDEQREKIKNCLKKDGKVLLWSYAPGLINNDKVLRLSARNCSELTGMEMNYIMDKLSPMMNTVGSGEKYTFGAQPRPVTTGPGRALPEKPFIPDPVKVFPQFYVDDPEAQTLGQYLNTGRAGYAMKKFKDWTSIYVGTYLMPSKVLRAAAKEAGVHLYLENDNMVCHNRSLLGIHTKTPGKQIVRLPAKCDVYDIFGNKLIGKDIDSFEIPDGVGKTYLYFTGKEEDLMKQLRVSEN